MKKIYLAPMHLYSHRCKGNMEENFSFFFPFFIISCLRRVSEDFIHLLEKSDSTAHILISYRPYAICFQYNTTQFPVQHAFHSRDYRHEMAMYTISHHSQMKNRKSWTIDKRTQIKSAIHKLVHFICCRLASLMQRSGQLLRIFI